MTFIDLRDRYGITQLVFDMQQDAGLCEEARRLGREYVVQVEGQVRERSSKNKKLRTGDIEIEVKALRVLSRSEVPPFTIEEESDGGEEIRMKYRYLDLRRTPLRDKLLLRHQVAQQVRRYLDAQGFLEIETPALIKSTPEGARDFVVPSRLHTRQFYALPQSPQIFKQLLMIAGYDKYFQLVKCFRDEDLRADRQPEFTQVDCEMSFVEQEDILQVFEGLIKELLSSVVDYKITEDFPRMTWAEAMQRYGTDKPDIRFGLELHDLTGLVKGKGFRVLDEAAYAGAICVPGMAEYSRKQLDHLTEWVRRPQIGAKGLIYVKFNEDGSVKSSVDKFYAPEELHAWGKVCGASAGDLLLLLSGEKERTLFALSELRLEMAERLGLRDPEVFAPLWVTEFPLLEWDEEEKRYVAKHHPFTSPMEEDLPLLKSNPAAVRANAYDLVINGVEVGGGSIRIHDTVLQSRMLDLLGFSQEAAEQQFGFLLEALRYGTPPHGGIALGFDRLVALLGGGDSIRDYIAFPKNNAARDMMADAPNYISEKQLNELNIRFRE
jgi:aspartyl-tRNA synthetase